MIYQVKLKIKTMKIKPISPVVFGNIAKTIFEILPEEEAKAHIYKLLEQGILFSDILPLSLDKLTEYIDERLEKNELSESQTSDLLQEKKRTYKQQRFEFIPVIEENFIEIVRRRTRVNRENGIAEEGFLFNDIQRWYDYNNIYTFYVAVNSEEVIPLLDLVLRVIEKTGLGTDTSIGAGQLELIRQNGKVLTRVPELEKMFTENTSDEVSVNIASTLLVEEVLKKYEFIRYCVERYDSRNPCLVKPPYFYIPAGSLIRTKDSTGPGSFLKEYKSKGETAFIYTCVFPLRIKRKGAGNT